MLDIALLNTASLDIVLLDTALLSVLLVTYVEKDSITFRMHQPKKPELILASSSPRRQELLREIGIPFVVHAANINEDQFAHEPPIAYALRLAQEKAEAVAAQYPQSYVLGADTIVVIMAKSWASLKTTLMRRACCGCFPDARMKSQQP